MMLDILNKGLEAISDTALGLKQAISDAIVPESMQFYTNIRLDLLDSEGNVKQTEEFHNLITTAGKDKLLASGGTAKYVKDFAYIAIGTNSTAANAADTTIGTEVARSLATLSNPDAHTYQAQVTFAAGTGTGTIVEVGLLDASSTGNLLMHQIFSSISKGASDSLQVTIQIS